MKTRHFLPALAIIAGTVAGQARAADVPVFNYGDPATFAILYDDFYSFSLPILSSAVLGFTQESLNFGKGDPYYINTANVIQDALVVGTGSGPAGGDGGNKNNQDLDLTGTVSNGYEFPNLVGDGSTNFNSDGSWFITLDALRQYLTVDGVLYDMMAYFNNNQIKKTEGLNSLLAKATVTLTGDGKTDKTFEFNDNGSWVLSGGPVTLCFNWTDPALTGKNDLRTEVSCADSHTTTSTYEHNLGQNDVAYGLTSLELNAILKDLNSGYTKMLIDVDFLGLNNGFENLYLAAACVNCGNEEVPEPGTVALLGLALAGLGFMRYRKS